MTSIPAIDVLVVGGSGRVGGSTLRWLQRLSSRADGGVSPVDDADAIRDECFLPDQNGALSEIVVEFKVSKVGTVDVHRSMFAL